MNFHSTDYGLFLVVMFAAFWLTCRDRLLRSILLLAGSYFFYAQWSASYLALIVISTGIDYFAGQRMAELPDDRAGARRSLLLLSLVANLGMLATFKYYGFFAENIEAALGLDLPGLDVLLPVGISFYTFQSLSYTIDIYRRQLEPSRNFGEFALYVAFFPQLVAGPIVRASTFLPQLERRPKLSKQDLHGGVWRIFVGLFKKVLIADTLAIALVDPVFAGDSEVSGAWALLGVYAYALQIYCDFSGYSDIAIGSARLLGFDIPENFARPYLARSIQDFWRRWHISLSTWLRDYLYIPLGGNRHGVFRTYLSLSLTMLLGGLWHGAAWAFVLWGALHGLWLVVGRLSPKVVDRLPGPVASAVGTLGTFHLVCFAWVFFRAGSDLGVATSVLSRIVSAPAESLPLETLTVVALVAGLATHGIPRGVETACRDAVLRMPSWLLGFLATIPIGLLKAISDLQEGEGVPFIYFQF